MTRALTCVHAISRATTRVEGAKDGECNWLIGFGNMRGVGKFDLRSSVSTESARKVGQRTYVTFHGSGGPGRPHELCSQQHELLRLPIHEVRSQMIQDRLREGIGQGFRMKLIRQSSTSNDRA